MNYTPVRISTLKAERSIPFNVYIHYKEQYLKYLAGGQQIEKVKYKKLRRQKITKFYIEADDEGKYQKFLDDMLNETLNDSGAAVEEKISIVEGQAETALDRMQDDPGSESSFNMARKAAQNLRKMIFENPDALSKMFGNAENTDKIAKHSINVCVLASKFAASEKISDEQIDYLCTAALMHDVALAKMSEEQKALFDKPRNELSAKEKLSYFEHCNENFISMLADRPYINEQVITLIKNHEENLQGAGPYKKTKLEPTEIILSLVNTYEKKISGEGLTPPEALKKMSIDEMGNYDLKMINRFKEFLKKEGVI
jgi:HD-GYP domain-containing protein (c-di-GMP phosphodiesterase class II)